MGAGSASAGSEPEPQPDWAHSTFPLLADKVREQGYDLPLPFGVSTSVIYMRRDIKVENVQVAVGDGDLRAVNDLLDVDVTTNVVNVAARFDVWVLPFLNVYGLLGYTENESDVRLRIGPVLPGGNPIEIREDGGFDGVTWGGGATLAAGYEWFFATFDTTYALTDIGLDDDVPALILALRTGWNGDIQGVPSRLWVGGTYWDTERTVSGRLRLPDGETLRFRVKQGPVNPFNANVGGHVELTKNWQLAVDTGFNFEDAFTLVANVSYRF